MCGRYTIFTDAAALAARFHAYVPPSLLAPSYNAAPSQGLPTILMEARQNNLAIFSINVVCWALCRTQVHRPSQRSLSS
jgi:putative SOS response-associated peptidase YedK